MSKGQLGLAIVVLAGTAAPLVAQCEPRWVPEITTINNPVGFVDAMDRMPDGRVIVAGYFPGLPNGSWRTPIGVYDPATGLWSTMGENLEGSVFTVVAAPDGRVIAGGGFDRLAGVTLQRIAEYSEVLQNWTELSVGPPWLGRVERMAALPNRGLIAATGDLFGDDCAVAFYDDDSAGWMNLALSGCVRALTLLRSGDVVAAGRFTSIDLVAAASIAMRDGNTGVWRPLATGAAADIRAVAEAADGSVIAAGFFSAIAGVPPRNIARCDIESGLWTPLGEGLDGYVSHLAARSNGNIIASGYRSNAGYFVAQYDIAAGTWTDILVMPTGRINAIELLADGDLLVGGSFSTIAGIDGLGIARYTFGGPLCGCPADWDRSGGIDGDDIGAFFADWQAGDADIDRSGGTDGDDITFFFARWQAGC